MLSDTTNMHFIPSMFLRLIYDTLYNSGAQPHVHHVPLSAGENFDVQLSRIY